MDCRVSVIIPFYNGIAYLADCVQSVQAQTLREIEILLVDDGSVDGSGEAADRMAAADARIRVLHQSNQGVSAARNRALDVARGAYIGFVDADDLVAPEMFAALYETAERTGSDIVSCAYRSFDDRGVFAQSPPPSDPQKLLTPEDVLDALPTMSTARSFQFIWRRLFSAALIRAHNIRFDVDIAIGEDTLFCLDCFLHASRAAALAQPLYYYRHQNASVMRRRVHNPKLLPSLEKQYVQKLSRCRGCCAKRVPDFLRDAAARSYTDLFPLLMRDLFRMPGGRYRAFRNAARTAMLRDMTRYLDRGVYASRSPEWLAFLCLRVRLYFTAYCIEKHIFGKDM